MRKLLSRSILLAVLLGAVLPATAQMAGMFNMGHLMPAPATYQGPGDTNGAAVYFNGWIGYTAAFSTGSNAAANLCDAVTGLICQDFNILSNGKFDAASAATFCTAHTSCVVSRLYDQTGNGHDIFTNTLAEMPAYSPSAFGTCAAMTLTAVNTLTSNSPITQALPYSIASVVKKTSAASFGYFVGAANINGAILFSNNANFVSLFAGSTNDVAATDGVNHVFLGSFDVTGSAGKLAVDGSTTTGLAPGTLFPNNVQVGTNGGSFTYAGTFLYGGFWAGDKSANGATLNSNVRGLCSF